MTAEGNSAAPARPGHGTVGPPGRRRRWLRRGGAGGGEQDVPIEFLQPLAASAAAAISTRPSSRRWPNSIRERGILQPLLVRPGASGAAGYEIVAGERRWRAAQRAGLHEVPAVVRELSDQETLELALIENLQRTGPVGARRGAGLPAADRGFRHTQEVLAQAVGKSRSHVANTLRLLSLPAEVQELIDEGACPPATPAPCSAAPMRKFLHG